MPIYLWRGPGNVEETESVRVEPPTLSEPTSESLVSDSLYVCTVEGCGRQFRKTTFAARHFNSAHSDKVVDGNSWRGYVKDAVER